MNFSPQTEPTHQRLFLFTGECCRIKPFCLIQICSFHFCLIRVRIDRCERLWFIGKRKKVAASLINFEVFHFQIPACSSTQVSFFRVSILFVSHIFHFNLLLRQSDNCSATINLGN